MITLRPFCVALFLTAGFLPAPGRGDVRQWKFDFGAEVPAAGYVRVLAGDVYARERGYGFEPGAKLIAVDRGGPDSLRGNFLTSDQPFLFSVALPEGNYRIDVVLGDAEGTSETAIKAELRRLMVESARTERGRFTTRRFNVNIRTPAISPGVEVRLKERERTTEFAAWDDKLTLEFNGARPCVGAVEITRVDALTTVFLLGDSTVCDQPKEPWNSWGQMLPRFLDESVVVANHAESGESLRSSLGARRLDKVLGVMKPGDYLFIQYGHNDMKERGEGVGAFASYKADLGRFVAAARARGGIPVLVTSMHRKNLDAAGKIVNTLGDYPEAVRRLAAEEKIALIDLNALSARLYEALGPARIDAAFQDATHHNNYGSYELAKCVAVGLRATGLELARHLVSDLGAFDPDRPDSPESFKIPASPMAETRKPDGS